MKKNTRRTFCLVLAMLFTVTAFSFNLVSGAAAAKLDDKALFIDGYPDGTFLPDKTMTRAEAIKVAAVAAGYSASFNAASIKTEFTDLNESEWYAPYVKYLEKYDILDFYGKTLSAGSGITRGEFVKLIEGFVPAKAGSKSFPDVPKTHPYYNAIIKAAKAGIVEGNPDGTFKPDGTLTRAQIVTIIDRLIKRNAVTSNAAKITKFSDIKGHWAEGYVIAASCAATYEGKILWYTGNAYAANSPVDKTKLDYSTTNAVMNGIDKTNAEAVYKSIEALREKRISEIRSTPNMAESDVFGKKVYYVSSSTGNDANDGLTPETAWATLDKVNNATLKNGYIVKFKRGDVFRGKITTKYGVTYTAYGEGAKPVINGSLQNYAGGTYWQPTEKKNVYVSSTTFDEDVGNLIFDDKDVGFKKTKGLNGTSLFFDLEFHYNTDDKKVYLYSVQDPNTRFKSIEICTYTPMIKGNGTKVTIDNLCVLYGGGYAISFTDGTSNLTITNCEIGWCGGALWRTDPPPPVRYGNGAEIHGSSNNFTVSNCYIYQMFDSGVSHQNFTSELGSIRRDMINIKYTDNVIEGCAMGGLEYVNSASADQGIMKNIEVSHNLFVRTGESWGLQRSERNGHMQVAVMGRPDVNNAENFIIYDNVFSVTHEEAQHFQIGAEDAAYMPEITGNLFYGVIGNDFGVYGAETGINRYDDMIPYNEKITDVTIGLDDNTFVFGKK